MLYNFLTLIVDLEPWVQNFYEYQGNFLNVCTYCHYSKITENNDKEEILKAAKGKLSITFKGPKLKLISSF